MVMDVWLVFVLYRLYFMIVIFVIFVVVYLDIICNMILNGSGLNMLMKGWWSMVMSVFMLGWNVEKYGWLNVCSNLFWMFLVLFIWIKFGVLIVSGGMKLYGGVN